MADELPLSFLESARRQLASIWQSTSQSPAIEECTLDEEIRAAIDRSINSKTKTYRYVLPTQLLAKRIDAALDCRSVQAGSGLTVAFDARTLCHNVIVEFDRRHHNVLGGSTEPYLNNPLRIPSLTAPYAKVQKNKAGFDDLRRVLDYAQDNPDLVPGLFVVVLQSIRQRLALVAITYPVPNRVSLKQTLAVLAGFLRERTGGLRLQSVAVALFRAIGERWRLFTDVHSANINAADVSTGSAADLECRGPDGTVVMAIEVKDRQLTLRHTQDKLPAIRQQGIKELLFLVQGGIEPGDREAVEGLVDQQFVTGQNVYVTEFHGFLESCLMLFGESGRRAFLQRIGEELDRQRADLEHRQRWAELLEKI